MLVLYIAVNSAHLFKQMMSNIRTLYSDFFTNTALGLPSSNLTRMLSFALSVLVCRLKLYVSSLKPISRIQLLFNASGYFPASLHHYVKDITIIAMDATLSTKLLPGIK